MGRAARVILLVAALVGLAGALINGDWLIGAGFGIVAVVVAAMLARAGTDG